MTVKIYDPNLFVDRVPELKGFGKLLQDSTPEAVLLIEADELMGKTWLLDRMCDQCSAEAGQAVGEVTHPPLVKIDFRQQKNQIQDTLSLVRLIRDALGQSSYYSELNAVINLFTGRRPEALVDAMQSLAIMLGGDLEGNIEGILGFDEAKELSQAMGIEYDNLEGGEVAKLYVKCYSLVVTLEGKQRLPDLFAYMRKKFPERDLGQEEQAIAAARAACPQPAGTPMEDLGNPLPVEGRRRAEAKISGAFLACLHKLEVEHKPVIVFFDSVEEAPDWAILWIRDELLGQMQTGGLTDVVVIAAGRDTFKLQRAGTDGLVKRRPLPGLKEEDIPAFLKAYKVPYDEKTLEDYIKYSGGTPGMLAKMADNQLAHEQMEDPFFQ
jgi:hypothetical protein